MFQQPDFFSIIAAMRSGKPITIKGADHGLRTGIVQGIEAESGSSDGNITSWVVTMYISAYRDKNGEISGKESFHVQF